VNLGAWTAAIVLGLAAPALAAAPPRTASLGWTRLAGAETCAGTRALAEAVEARLGRPAFVSAARADVAIEGHIEPGPEGGWRAMIAVADDGERAPRTRELRSDAASCRAFDEELALVISLMIDPDAALGPPPRPARPPPHPTPLPAPARAPATTAPTSWRAGQQAGAVIALGLFPALGVGFTFRERIVPPRWPAFEIGGALWFPRQTSVAAVGATFWLAEGLLSLCPLAASPFGVDLQGCAGVRLGVMRVDGFGFSGENHQQVQPALAASIEARARHRVIGPLAAGAGVELIVPVIRNRFCFDCSATLDAPSHTLFQMSPVAGAFDLTLGVDLP
jgi:hypothetical protein